MNDLVRLENREDTGRVSMTIYDREYVCDECLKQWESRSEEPMTFCPYCQSDEEPRIIGKWRAYD